MLLKTLKQLNKNIFKPNIFVASKRSFETIPVNQQPFIDFKFVEENGDLIDSAQSPSLAHTVSTDNAPLLEHTFHSLLRTQANVLDGDSSNPQYLFYFHETGEKITYKQFVQDVESTAKALIRLGITKGDRVGMYTYFFCCELNQ